MRRLIAVLLLTFSLLAFNSCGYIDLVDSSDRVEYYRKLGKRNLLGYMLMKGIYGTERTLAREGVPVDEEGHLEDIALDISIKDRYLFRLKPNLKIPSDFLEEESKVMLEIRFLGEKRN